MGYMTTVTFQNDMWNTIKENPEEFIRTIEEGMSGAIGNYSVLREGEVSDFGIAYYANGLKVAQAHHADDVRLYYVGENMMVPIGHGSGECQNESNIAFRKDLLKKAQRLLDVEKRKIEDAEQRLKTSR